MGMVSLCTEYDFSSILFILVSIVIVESNVIIPVIVVLKSIIVTNRLVKAITLLLAVVGYNCYFIAAIWWGVSNNGQLDYCDDVGFLIIVTVFLYIFLFYFLVVKRFLGGALQRAVLDPALLRKDKLLSHRHRFLILSSFPSHLFFINSIFNVVFFLLLPLLNQLNFQLASLIHWCGGSDSNLHLG